MFEQEKAAHKSSIDGFFTVWPLLAVTGMSSLLWLEGTSDREGAWGSSNDKFCKGKVFVSWLSGSVLSWLLTTRLPQAFSVFSEGFNCTLLHISADPPVVLTM